MIDTWPQRENAEKRAIGKKPQMTLAVIILHIFEIWYKRPVNSSPTPSSHPNSSPLHTYLLSRSRCSLQQNVSARKNLSSKHFIMVNKAIPVNGNHAVNGAVSDIAITSHGSNWYFVSWRVLCFLASNVCIASLTPGMIKAVCAVMFVSTLAIVGVSFTKPRPHRIFHYITAAITLVASIAYFSMGSDLGQTPIAVQFQRNNPKVHGVNREIFYVRYIDWLVISHLLGQAKCRLIWS